MCRASFPLCLSWSNPPTSLKRHDTRHVRSRQMCHTSRPNGNLSLFVVPAQEIFSRSSLGWSAALMDQVTDRCRLTKLRSLSRTKVTPGGGRSMKIIDSGVFDSNYTTDPSGGCRGRVVAIVPRFVRQDLFAFALSLQGHGRKSGDIFWCENLQATGSVSWGSLPFQNA